MTSLRGGTTKQSIYVNDFLIASCLAMTATCIVITLFCRGLFPCPCLAMTMRQNRINITLLSLFLFLQDFVLWHNPKQMLCAGILTLIRDVFIFRDDIMLSRHTLKKSRNSHVIADYFIDIYVVVQINVIDYIPCRVPISVVWMRIFTVLQVFFVLCRVVIW